MESNLELSKKNKKDNRWDKIKKKCVNSNVNVTTDTVRKFLNIDFINNEEIKILNGTKTNNGLVLDPVLVMNLRHNLVEKPQSLKNQLQIQDVNKLMQIESIENHNKSLEKVVINSEILKLKNDLKILRAEKTNKSQKLTIKNKVFIKNVVHFEFLTEDYNSTIMPNETINNEENINTGIFNKIFQFQNEEELREEKSESSGSSSSMHTDITSTPESLTDEELTTRKMVTIKEDKEDFTLDSTPKIIIKPIVGTKRPNFIITNNINNSVEPKVENTEKDKIITELFNATVKDVNKEHEREVLRKAFHKWLVVINLAKISDQSLVTKESRMRKINDFLTKIRKEKNQMKDISKEGEKVTLTKTHNKIDPIILTKTYRQKLKIQNEMIEIQKLKLERQEQIITELKLSKMFDESKHSKFEIKCELNNIIHNGTVRLRSKARSLQINGNLKAEEEKEEEIDESKKLQAKGKEAPRFLAKMEARALERCLRHAEAKEKRLRLEKEKEEAKIAVEEAKRLEDEKVKHERYEALREKRRHEKQMKIIRERDRLRYIENYKKATEFYRLKLLNIFGISQFRKLILIKKRNEKKAKLFYRRILVNKIFRAWKIFTVKVWEKKKRNADLFHKKILIRQALNLWKRAHLIAQSKLLVAIDLYELRLSEKCINLWSANTKQSLLYQEYKMRQAEAHYNWHLKWKSIERWQRLHAILKIEKETEERRLRWRIKIWELLPDYQPNKEE